MRITAMGQHTLMSLLRELIGNDYIPSNDNLPADAVYALKSENEHDTGIAWAIKNTRGILLLTTPFVECYAFADYQGLEVSEHNQSAIQESLDIYIANCEDEIQRVNESYNVDIKMNKSEIRLHTLIHNTDSEDQLVNAVIAIMEVLPEIMIV